MLLILLFFFLLLCVLGIAAGGGGLIIVILISVLIWLSLERKKYKNTEKNRLSDEEANANHKRGFHNSAISLTDKQQETETEHKVNGVELRQKASIRG